MPFHRFYVPTGLYSSQDKKDIANSLTKLYAGYGLPKFYVVTVFHELTPENFFIGDETFEERQAAMGGRPFVRILSQHVARAMPTKEIRLQFTDAVLASLKPFLDDRGYMYEFNIGEASSDLARKGPYQVPIPRSETERIWVEQNFPSAYDDSALVD